MPPGGDAPPSYGQPRAGHDDVSTAPTTHRRHRLHARGTPARGPREHVARAGATARQERTDQGGADAMDVRLEVVTIPVSDVDRAREFYQRLGWRLDVTPPGIVQLTPPGSGCSVQFGAGRT